MIEKNAHIHVDRKRKLTLHGNAARVDPKKEIRNNYLAQAYYEGNGRAQSKAEDRGAH